MKISLFRSLFVVTIFVAYFNIGQISAQTEDNIWLMGYTHWTPANPDTSGFSGCTIFDFNDLPLKIYKEPDQFMNFQDMITSICDSNGNLLFYSNGMQIKNKNFDVVDGGDTIAYGKFWERFVNQIDGDIFYDGLRVWQGAISLPYPGHLGWYIMIYEDIDININRVNHLYYAIIDMNANNGLGKVLAKDIDLVYSDDKTIGVVSFGKISACKHGNGRDWWIIVPDEMRNKYLVYLLDPSGINLNSEQQLQTAIGHDLLGVANFSPDGAYYGMIGIYEIGGTAHLRLYDFDRCKGKLSNERADTIKGTFDSGLCFSPDNRFLYLSNQMNIYQFDLTHEDYYATKQIVATWDRTWKDEWGTRYSLGYLVSGQDGKIYIIPGSSYAMNIHRINKPNSKGSECNVQQRIIKLPTKVGTAHTLHNFPNFRLGPLDGSECDTLGLDNHPVSRFSYEQDSLDHLKINFTDLSYFEPEKYKWEFGDSVESNEENPIHIFPAKGSYEVCLTVENGYSSDKSCRTLNLGVVSNQETGAKIEIGIFPNPVEDILLVTLSDYVPENAVMEFYDLMGKKTKESKLYYGMNSLDVSNLKPGYIFYRIVENNVILKTGKLIKLK